MGLRPIDVGSLERARELEAVGYLRVAMWVSLEFILLRGADGVRFSNNLNRAEITVKGRKLLGEDSPDEVGIANFAKSLFE